MNAEEMRALCIVEVAQLVAEFEEVPSRKGFYDLGATAEILAFGTPLESVRPLRATLAGAALRWLRSGQIEDVMFNRVEFLYHAALLCHLASEAPGYADDDATQVRRLLTSGLVGRSELPVVTMQVIADHLQSCDIHVDRDAVGARDLRVVLDRRVLRPRSDEYDVLTVIMVAQLCSRGNPHGYPLPRVFPHLMLVQAIRAGHVNWIPVLALLCTQVFGMPAWLRRGARDAAASALANATGLLPTPETGLWENDLVKRADRGLRIRSSIATFALLA